MLSLVVAAVLSAAPPLAPGAWKELTAALSTDVVAADVDVSAAADALRDRGCRKSRFVADRASARQIPGSTRFVVDARAQGVDAKGNVCALDVVVHVAFSRRVKGAAVVATAK